MTDQPTDDEVVDAAVYRMSAERAKVIIDQTPGPVIALIHKLMDAGVEYTTSARYGGHDTAELRGYDPHGNTDLIVGEEDLLRVLLDMPVGKDQP